MAKKSFSIRIDEELLQKLQVIAEYEKRSTNSQIVTLIRRCTEEYEKKGRISTDILHSEF